MRLGTCALPPSRLQSYTRTGGTRVLARGIPHRFAARMQGGVSSTYCSTAWATNMSTSLRKPLDVEYSTSMCAQPSPSAECRKWYRDSQ